MRRTGQIPVGENLRVFGDFGVGAHGSETLVLGPQPGDPDRCGLGRKNRVQEGAQLLAVGQGRGAAR